jgi:hypothetical protein
MFITSSGNDYLAFSYGRDSVCVQDRSARNICTFYSNGNVLSLRGNLIGKVDGPLSEAVMASLVMQWRSSGKLD